VTTAAQQNSPLKLERIHTERGDSAGSERFGELRRRFQRAAGLSDEDLLARTLPLRTTSTPKFRSSRKP